MAFLDSLKAIQLQRRAGSVSLPISSDTANGGTTGADCSDGFESMTAPWTYRAWLIDLDGTLYHSLPVKLAMAAELFLGHWAVVAPLRVFREEHDRVRDTLAEPCESPFQLQVQQAAQRLGCPPERLQQVVYEWMCQRPGKWIRWFRRTSLIRDIARFRETGGKTALVSDYPARQKLKALGADDLFDVVVANGELDGPRRMKPWPQGFLAAAARLNVDPQHCLAIGDRPELDGVAAHRAGIDYAPVDGAFLKLYHTSKATSEVYTPV